MIPSSLTRRSIGALVASSVCATGLALLAGAPPAAAATPVQHDPISSTIKIHAAPAGLLMTGWVTDPDAPTQNVVVSAVLDGKKTIASAPTSRPDAGVTAKYGAGTTPAFSLTVPVPTGNHIVCAVFGNVGGGLVVVKRCVTTPLGRVLTVKQRAKRSPRGAITSATATAKSIRLTGWATDPDYVARRSQYTVYLNGRAQKIRTTTAFTGVRPAGAGSSSRFAVTIPVASATQLACIRVVNVGLGRSTSLGCRALDPRSAGTTAATTPPAVVPALNTKVLALAKKQIGKPYVWAAAGPKAFDCSGLVTWAYKKYGYRTPRVSQDQSRAARLIPLSRALPGDLVFYHDDIGDVFHVGIFIKPGLSVAAIDTDQGVNYQNIWDTTATYGSFTHT